MKILLIQTGISDTQKKSMGQGNMNRINMPMLGLLYIAASINKEHDVTVIDEVHGVIEEFRYYDIVGISGMTLHANRMYYLGDQYRKLGCYVVMGGVHVSFMVEEALQHADTVIVGEGENLWKEFLEDINNEKPKKVYRSNQQLELSKLPKIDLKLVDGDAYKAPRGTLNSIITTRGCPNHCAFCCVKKMFNSNFRTRPVDCVIEEIDQLERNIIIFQDDNIIGNLNYAKELFSKMIPLQRKWGGQASINVADNSELLDTMEKSGCRTLFIGFESINPDNINQIHKNGVNKTYKYEEQIKRLHDKGIKIFGSFIVGFDDDTESVFDDIYEFCVKTKVDFPIVNCLTPFPGTDLYYRLIQENRIIDSNWDKYNLNNVVIRPKNMEPDELQYQYSTLSFYLNKLTYNNINSLF